MKEFLYRLLNIMSVPLGVFLIFYSRFSYLDHVARKENAKEQIGKYVIDLTKTNMGVYVKDTLNYKNLTVVFDKDKTFSFNKKVPFIYDSTGTWEPAGNGAEDWNWLIYDKKNGLYEIRNQMSCSKATLYINNTTPDLGNEQIPVIRFKKIE